MPYSHFRIVYLPLRPSKRSYNGEFALFRYQLCGCMSICVYCRNTWINCIFLYMWVKISNTIAYGISLVSNLYIKLGKHQHYTPKHRQHMYIMYQIILAVTVFKPFNLESSSYNLYADAWSQAKRTVSLAVVPLCAAISLINARGLSWQFWKCAYSVWMWVWVQYGWWMLYSITLVCWKSICG